MASIASKFFPSTVIEFAQTYAKIAENMDAEGTVKLCSTLNTNIHAGDAPQKTLSKDETRDALVGFYSVFKQGNKTLRCADYSVYQLSDGFGVIRYVWEISDEKGLETAYINSAYLLRREVAGWRFFGVLELGPMQGFKNLTN